MKPSLSTYNPYFKDYIDLVPTENLLEELERTQINTQKLLSLISEEKANFRYAEGKWSIKELIVHLTDCERVFQFRTLSFARNDKTNLPGFEEDDFALHSKADNRTLDDIAEEFQSVRKATISLFNSFDEDDLSKTGMANGGKLNVNACGFIICGHEIHHVNVLKERYML